MTVERSKRRFLIPIVFTTKCFKKTSTYKEVRTYYFIVYVTHWSVHINMQGDKETLSGYYKSSQVVINKVLSIYNQVWYGSILSIN